MTVQKLAFNAMHSVAIPALDFAFGNIPAIRKLYSKYEARTLPNSQKTVHLVNGFDLRLYVNRHGIDEMSSSLMARKTYDPVATRVLTALAQTGMVAVDVGACIGYYSVLLSRLVGDKGRVIAVEPEAANFKSLCANLQLNQTRNVQPVQAALSDTDGWAALHVSERESAEHHLVRNQLRRVDRTVVRTMTLDRMLGESAVDVSIVKVVTNGSEAAVLWGGCRALTRNENLVLLVAFRPVKMRESGYDDRDLWKALTDNCDFRYFYAMNEVGKTIISAPLGVVFDEATTYCENHKISMNLLCSRKNLDHLILPS